MIGMQFVDIGGGELPMGTAAILDSSMAGFDDEGTYITEIHVWNGVGYNIYGWSGTSGTEYLEDSEYDNKWLNDQLEIPEDNVVLPYGRGVWIKAGSSGSITFTK